LTEISASLNARTTTHTGNILVRMLDQHGNVVDDDTGGITGMLADNPGPATAVAGAAAGAGTHPYRAQIVLLDFGLVRDA
jgi:hypothetical protein